MPIFQQQAIGLDITDHSAEAILILRKGRQNVVSSYGLVSLPPGVVVDGFVERRDELSAILRKLLADQMQPPLPKGMNRIVFALPESQVYSHIFEVPRLADVRELGRALAIEADGFFPYHHEEMAAGYTVIKQSLDKKEIYYAAVHTETLKSYLSLFAATGLTPIALESESTSIARAILQPDEREPSLVIDIRARLAELSVFDPNGIQFSESFAVAGDAFTHALSKAMGIGIPEAESLKRSQGLSGELDPKARKALRAVIDRLLAGVLDAIAYYQARSQRQIRQILICGGGSLMPGLFDYLAEHLSTKKKGRKVRFADPWKSLQLVPALERHGVKGRGVLLTTAIGLGLRGAGVRKFSEIDFLTGFLLPSSGPALAAPPEIRRKGWPESVKVGLVGLAIIAVPLLAWLASFTIIPKLQKHPLAPPVMKAPSAIDLEVKATLGEAFSEEKNVLTGVPLAVEITKTKVFPRQGTPSDGRASGTMVIINDAGKPQTLVERTRFLSGGGILFRLDHPVDLPSGSRVSAQVTADAAGAQGDVSPGHFTIPGLSEPLQAKIYGESQEAMHGGVVYTGAPYTDEDFTMAKKALSDEASAELFQKAVTYGVGQEVMKDLFTVTSLESITAPKVGIAVGDYTMTALVKGKAIAISAEEAGKILKKALAARADVADPLLYQLSTISYSAQDFKPETNSATVILKTTASPRS